VIQLLTKIFIFIAAVVAIDYNQEHTFNAYNATGGLVLFKLNPVANYGNVFTGVSLPPSYTVKSVDLLHLLLFFSYFYRPWLVCYCMIGHSLISINIAQPLIRHLLGTFLSRTFNTPHSPSLYLHLVRITTCHYIEYSNKVFE